MNLLFALLIAYSVGLIALGLWIGRHVRDELRERRRHLTQFVFLRSRLRSQRTEDRSVGHETGGSGGVGAAGGLAGCAALIVVTVVDPGYGLSRACPPNRTTELFSVNRSDRAWTAAEYPTNFETTRSMAASMS